MPDLTHSPSCQARREALANLIDDVRIHEETHGHATAYLAAAEAALIFQCDCAELTALRKVGETAQALVSRCRAKQWAERGYCLCGDDPESCKLGNALAALPKEEG